MRWPSKDPDDYTQPGRWETDPPRWLARLRGKPNPDPVPYWMALAAGVGGFALGDAFAALVGWSGGLDDPARAGFAGAIVAQLALDLGWRLTRRRRSRRRGVPSEPTA